MSAQLREEKLYECEVKRIRVVEGKRSTFWKVKSVREAIEDGDSEFRCKECHGAVKLFRKHVAHAAAPHVEHVRRSDSEYCSAGMYFRQATDGRLQRLSESPVS